MGHPIPPRADSSWIPTFREKYEAWIQGARALLEAHQYSVAFKTYPFPAFEETPWSPFAIPLTTARLGVVTTAGLYRRGIDPPFADTAEGDPRVLALSSGVDGNALDVSHSHIPENLVREDVNVVLPLDHLRSLVQERRLAALAPRVFSLVGYRTRADEVAQETAAAIAAAMAEDGVTLGLVVPV
jgi:D-proline reductase (dithiol) PrdB